MRRPSLSRGPGVTVEADWFGVLPASHLLAFRNYAKELESCYVMFSVSFNEAIDLRNHGSLAISLQAIALASALCARLSDSLENALASMARHSQEYGTMPSVAPLNPADFHSRRGKYSARRSYFLNRLKLSQQAKFLEKISALRALVANKATDFRKAAEDLASSAPTVEPSPSLWASLDEDQFDLNTCLRESIVLLRCFLRSLRGEELASFETTASMRNSGSQTSPRNPGAVWRWIPISH
jgi:hypothetical protein